MRKSSVQQLLLQTSYMQQIVKGPELRNDSEVVNTSSLSHFVNLSSMPVLFSQKD